MKLHLKLHLTFIPVFYMNSDLVFDKISKLSSGTERVGMEGYGRSRQLALETFNNKIKNFIVGLNSLMASNFPDSSSC